MPTLLLLALAFTCSSCAEAGRQGRADEDKVDDTVAVPVFEKQEVPSSQRSRKATARVAPALIRDLGRNGLALGSPIFIRLFKAERELEVWVKEGAAFKLFRTYSIVAMSGRLGPKLREGDRQAPEGFYFVTPARMNPNSRFHLSFNLGYPNTYDRAHKRTGSALMVHGNRVSIGCFAMTDTKIEEIYCLADAALRNGQKFFRVHCFPFRMAKENMTKQRKSKWISFWENLKVGHDSFELTKQPPNVVVRNKKYVFEKAKD
jgi:murein L,D-transpeptidase YafK